jgi:hypothetical protein
MNTTPHIHSSVAGHTPAAELGADVAEVAGIGLRVIEIAMFAFIGLLFAPPLLILAVIVAVPTLAIAALVAAVVVAIAVPTALVRRVRAHHREHGSTMFLHRQS